MIDYMLKEVNRGGWSQTVQSLKGIAALMVFMSHSIGFYKSSEVEAFYTTPLHLFTDGQCAVMLFFAITGFLTYRENDINRKVYVRGIVRKFSRLYPTYIIVTLVAFILCNSHLSWDKSLFTDWSNRFWETSISYKELCKQLVLIYPTNWDLLNPPMWYMHIDTQMVFFLPIIILLVNKIGVWVILPFILSEYLWWIFPIHNKFITYYCFGILGRYLIDKESIRTIVVQKRIWIQLLVSGVIMLDIYNVIGMREWSAVGVYEKLHLVQSLGATLIVAIFYIKDFSFLKNKIFVTLGGLSYCVYLVHFPILLLLRSYPMNIVMFIFISFSLTILFASLLSKYNKWVNKIILPQISK